jgi:hypothetical protein
MQESGKFKNPLVDNSKKNARLRQDRRQSTAAAMGRTCFITNILPGKMDECELHRHQLLSAGWAGWLARVTKLSAHQWAG